MVSILKRFHCGLWTVYSDRNILAVLQIFLVRISRHPVLCQSYWFHQFLQNVSLHHSNDFLIFLCQFFGRFSKFFLSVFLYLSLFLCQFCACLSKKYFSVFSISFCVHLKFFFSICLCPDWVEGSCAENGIFAKGLRLQNYHYF